MLSKVIERIYVGDLQDANSLVSSNPEIITAVLNVCEERDDFSGMPWMKYLHIPFADNKPIPQVEFEKCMDWLEQRYKTLNNILIHCALGRSRSPVICAAFLTKINIVASTDEGYLLVKAARAQADAAIEVIGSAKAYLQRVRA